MILREVARKKGIFKLGRAKFASQGTPRWMNSPQARSEELEREKRDLMAESADSVDHKCDPSL